MVLEMAERLGRNRRAPKFKPRIFVWVFRGRPRKEDGAVRYPAVNFYGLNPGLMKSNIRSGTLGEGSFGLRLSEIVIGALFPSVEEYSERILPLLASPDIEDYSGAIFNRHGDAIHASRSLSEGSNLETVIEESERLQRMALAA